MKENEQFKFRFDKISNSYVLTKEQSKEDSRYKYSPRAFAQKFFYKLGEEAEQNSDGEEKDLDINYIERDLIPKEVGRKKMIFRQGSCEEVNSEQNTYEEAQPFRSQLPRPPFPPGFPQPPRPPGFPQRPAELAREIYNEMLILNLLYQDLINFNTQFSEQLRDMASELRIITLVMLRIFQDLSGRRDIPVQNQRRPNINSFCQGVVVTSNYLRGIMFDVRSLQRLVDVSNIDRQLIIINFTLQSQQSQLQQMRQDCIEGGNL